MTDKGRRRRLDQLVIEWSIALGLLGAIAAGVVALWRWAL